MRTWEVTVMGRAVGSRMPVARRRHTVCFDTTGTPRQGGLLVDCCERAETVFPDLEDQDLALCLEAARNGGLLWVDPRDGDLWWVTERQGILEMRSSGNTLQVPNTSGKTLGELNDPELTVLLDQAAVG